MLLFVCLMYDVMLSESILCFTLLNGAGNGFPNTHGQKVSLY